MPLKPKIIKRENTSAHTPKKPSIFSKQDFSGMLLKTALLLKGAEDFKKFVSKYSCFTQVETLAQK